MARTAADDDSSDDEVNPQQDGDHSALTLSLSEVQEVLAAEAGGTGEGDKRSSAKARAQRSRAVRRGQTMWSLRHEDGIPVDTSG